MLALALFENTGFIVNGKPNIRKIIDTPKSKLMHFCEEFAEITSYQALPPGHSIYSHSASLSLGGGPYPCASIECRIDKVKQLAQFATFYSDHVYLNNFTYRHVCHSNTTAGFKKDVIDDVTILAYLYPLMKEGLISFVTYDQECPHCIAISAIGVNMGNKYEEACDYLQEMYLTEVKYYLKREGAIIMLHTEGHESLIPHNNSYSDVRKKSDRYSYVNDIVGKSSSEVLLTIDQVKELELNKGEANNIIRSMAIELNGAHFLKTSFLSENELEIDFLKQLSDSNSLKRTNLMEKYLTCIVPFLQNVNPVNLLRLRNNENDSFVIFRQSLTKAIDEYKLIGESITERDAIALYSDIIQPNISRLDLKINSAKKNFSKDTTREVIGWVGAISAGFYLGVTTSSLLVGLAGLKIGADIIKNVMIKSDPEESIRNEEMYYLWKIKQLSK